ncbi:hypothetical protein AB0M43_33810 [Longispora sp. NPDC051575]|uniref:hypothetical protein n=1 Tax=Longispora sp. NPDC051575 TaxID=3154943 RepID=UPI003437063E
MRRLLALLLLTGLAGCASGTTPSDPPSGPAAVDEPQTYAITEQALPAWAAFPVDRAPRPVVLLHPSEDPDTIGGSDPTGNAKTAALTGKLVLAAGLPRGPVSTPEGVPLLSAADAWAAVSRPRPEKAPGSTPTALTVTAVTLGTTKVDTDRGPRDLPAWIFTTDSVALAWPALAKSEIWAPEKTPTVGSSVGTAKVSGSTVTVSLPKARQGCPGSKVFRYEPEVRESATSVAVGLRTVVTDEVVPGAPPKEPCAHDMMLVMEEYQVTLANPLGARVLVDNLGWPIAVA